MTGKLECSVHGRASW